jgi:hypothetical protein
VPRIAVRIKDKYYSLFNISKRNKEGGFVISFFRKPSDAHITFVSNGRHHFTLKDINSKLMLFDSKVIYNKKDISKEYPGESFKDLEFLKPESKMRGFIIPTQTSLFEIINGKDWTWGPMSTDLSDVSIFDKQNHIISVRKNDILVSAGQNLKLVLTMDKTEGDLIFNDLPYLYLVKV